MLSATTMADTLLALSRGPSGSRYTVTMSAERIV